MRSGAAAAPWIHSAAMACRSDGTSLAFSRAASARGASSSSAPAAASPSNAVRSASAVMGLQTTGPEVGRALRPINPHANGGLLLLRLCFGRVGVAMIAAEVRLGALLAGGD